MPRNMSFMLTTEQIRNKTKTVTRRLGWRFLKVGDIVNACVKCQGIPKGQKIEKICQIRITGVREECLAAMETIPNDLTDSLGVENNYGNREAVKEGFPDMTGSQFVQMFCENMKCGSTVYLTRIEFEYLE